jgi:TolA-binding protein
VDSLKREIYSLSTEGKERHAKTMAEVAALRRKDQAKIEQLQDQLSDKEEALEKIKLLLKQKEKQISEITDSSNSRFLKFKEEQEERVSIIQRRLEKQ